MANEARASLILELKDLVTDGIGKIGDKLTDLGANLEKSKWLWAGIFGSIVAGIGTSLVKFAEEESAIKSLNQALLNQGAMTTKTMDDLRAYASQLQSVTRFSDDNILSAQALMVSFGLLGNDLKKATKATLDLAAAKQIDLTTAAQLVGKAFVGETAMLSRYGIIIDENIPKSQKFAQTITEIGDRFGGQALAQGKTFTGQIDILKNTFEDFQESVGAVFAPIMGKIADVVTLVIRGFTDLSPLTKLLMIAGAGLVGAFSGLLLVTSGIVAIWPALVAGFAVVAAIFTPWTLGFIALATLLFMLKDSFTSLAEIAVGSMKRMKDSLSEVAEAFTLAIKGKWAEAWESLKNGSADAFGAISDGMVKSTEVVIEQGKKTYENLKAMVTQKKTQYDLDHNNYKLAEQKKYDLTVQNAYKLKELDKLNKLEVATLESAGRAERLRLEQLDYETRMKGADTYRTFMIGAVNSQHTALKAIAKVFMIQQTIMDTQAAAMGAYNALSRIPFVGPALGIAAAAAAIAYGAERVATISALAEGGMVLPTTGGTIARIGEAGKAEAVIPLDDSATQEKLKETLGSENQTVVININAGTLIADDLSVRDFARKIDKQLYELKKNRQAISI